MIRILPEILKTVPKFWQSIHFHPTDAIEDAWGKQYLAAVKEANAADTVRMYAMLEDIVSLSEDGTLKYDFTENDRRMDYMVKKGFNLLVSLNFIPPCIAEYDDKNNTEKKVSSRYKGKTICTMPPKDYKLWEDVCFEYISHIVKRYGLSTVKNFYLQCYNEPDIALFFLSPLGESKEALKQRCEEYCKLYFAFERAVRRVSPELKIGGPAAAGPEIFEYWLEFVLEKGLKFDFACAHSYGTRPWLINKGEKPIRAENNIEYIKEYDGILKKYNVKTELVIDEFGASCSGYWNLEDCPKLVMRENEVFSAFYGRLISLLVKEEVNISKLMICLSGSHQVHQLPDTFPEFNGFRSFFTEHFIPKPIFFAYGLMALLHSDVCQVDGQADNTEVLATKDGENYSVLLTYADKEFNDNLPDFKEKITLPLFGTYKIKIYKIDKTHLNPYRIWQKEKMSEKPTDEKIVRLKKAGELKSSLSFETEANGKTELEIELGCNGMALVLAEKI